MERFQKKSRDMQNLSREKKKDADQTQFDAAARLFFSTSGYRVDCARRWRHSLPCTHPCKEQVCNPGGTPEWLFADPEQHTK